MSMQSVGGVSGFDPTKMAESFFKKLDANNDGGIDKAEFLKARPKSQGISQNSDDLFSKIDSNSDGKIDHTENLAALKKMAAHEQKPAGQMQGPPPGGGGGGMGKSGGAQGSSSSSSDTSLTYDPADTNKDGTVSFEEAMQYSAKNPDKESSDKKQSTSYQQAAGINQYQKTAMDISLFSE